jgi:ligand-binding sensor domain-containing protein
VQRAAIIVLTLFLWMLIPTISAQVISFSHLKTSNGLSDNNAQSLSIDKNGFLWIGTTDGLNVYDGYGITTYYKSQYPGLASDTIRQLYCDSRNRMWIIHPGRVSWADEERKFHTVALPVQVKQFNYRFIYETALYGITLLTTEGHFRFNDEQKEWEKIDWISAIAGNTDLNAVISFSGDTIIYVYEKKVMAVDYKARRIIFEKDISAAVTACRFSGHSVAVATRTGIISIIDIISQKVLSNYEVYNEVNGKRSSPRLTEMVKASNGNLIVVTGLAGLMMIDSVSGNTSFYHHDPLQPGSVSTDLLYRVFAGAGGEVIVGATNSGVSICNINNKRAGYKNIFRDIRGNIFDGHANEMTEDRNGILWISAIDRLVRWDKKTNTSVFYPYYFNDPIYGPRNLEIRTLCIDQKGRIWTGAIGAGVALFDQQSGNFHLLTDTALGGAFSDTYVNDIIEASDGNIWACTYKGLYTINAKNYRLSRLDNHPVLKEVADKIVISLYEDLKHRIWIGTQRAGVYCFDRLANKLINYTTANGLLSNTGYAITGDKKGNIYVADNNGFNMIDSSGSVIHFSRNNGMRYHRCESIVVDDQGSAWIANNKCLVKFTAENKKLEYFEENAGISMDGFRFTAACKTANGDLYFGTHRGINYFNPSGIRNYTAQLKVNIYQVSFPDSIIRLTGETELNAGYLDNSVQFYFAAINLTGSRNIAYQYMLDGFDKDWQKGNDLHSARYVSLPPGKYHFRVKASIDRINWVEANNDVSIDIVPPFWKRWWFVAIVILLLAGIIMTLFWIRIRQVRYKERLKTIYNKKIADTEMKALRAQMNPHFIFNCLNSINGYIVQQDHTTASLYLTRFSKLIRLILDNSNSKVVTLSNELEALKLYIEMESLRFEKKFSYMLEVDESVRADSIQVPPLIIQPYVENAIWHGLLHKKTHGHLAVALRMVNDSILECTITDNGIGREKAQELKSKSVTRNKSLGMKLTEDRLHTLNQFAELNASIEIIDIRDENGKGSGTKVILKIAV